MEQPRYLDGESQTNLNFRSAAIDYNIKYHAISILVNYFVLFILFCHIQLCEHFLTFSKITLECFKTL